jgi:hypothetical protein
MTTLPAATQEVTTIKFSSSVLDANIGVLHRMDWQHAVVSEPFPPRAG